VLKNMNKVVGSTISVEEDCFRKVIEVRTYHVAILER
jgi:hypothetical protein